MRTKLRGFTLVESVICLAIVALISSIIFSACKPREESASIKEKIATEGIEGLFSVTFGIIAALIIAMVLLNHYVVKKYVKKEKAEEKKNPKVVIINEDKV